MPDRERADSSREGEILHPIPPFAIITSPHFLEIPRQKADIRPASPKENPAVLQEMKIACVIFLTMTAVFMASCSGSSEAKTRKEQEVEFTNAFGFSPPATIMTINYADLSNRGLTDGAYGQWMSFSFEQASFDKIIVGGYKEERNADIPNGSVSPAWWPKTIPVGAVIYSRSQDDTPANEGFQFREYIWHDRASGLVFFHKNYWD